MTLIYISKRPRDSAYLNFRHFRSLDILGTDNTSGHVSPFQEHPAPSPLKPDSLVQNKGMPYIPVSFDKVEYNVSLTARIVRMGFKPPSESGIRKLPDSEIRAPLPGYIRFFTQKPIIEKD